MVVAKHWLLRELSAVALHDVKLVFFSFTNLFGFKMLYLIGPDGLVNMSFENFQKMVWMTMVHVLNLGMHIVLTHAVFGKFAYLRFTR